MILELVAGFNFSAEEVVILHAQMMSDEDADELDLFERAGWRHENGDSCEYLRVNYTDEQAAEFNRIQDAAYEATVLAMNAGVRL